MMLTMCRAKANFNVNIFYKNTKGYFESAVESGNKITLARFYALNSEADCLLSGDTAIDLGILKLNRASNVTSQPNTPMIPPNTSYNT